MRDACCTDTAGAGIVRQRRSITVNLEDSFGKGLGSFLRQIAPDAARCLVRVHPRVRPHELDGHIRKENSHRVAIRGAPVIC
jgi:hypothetical protein